MLIELSKVNAPSLLLSEFNYYFNKAINQYINKRYNIYDISQQTTDDIRVLKSTAFLNKENNCLQKAYEDKNNSATSYLSSYNNKLSNLHGATYECILPSDYLHLLNCICTFKVNKTWKCYDAGSYVQFSATRLTADSWAKIIGDYYNRPTPERPYFYIHNINTNSTIPTNPVDIDENNNYVGGTDMVGIYGVTTNSKDGDFAEAGYSNASNIGSNFSRVINLNGDTTISTVEKATAHRYGNASKVRMEIRYGKDDSIFELVEVCVDYIKTPQFIRLTQEQVDSTEDTSQIMEFPDYVCQEIINELALLVMARTGDPVGQSFQAVTQSIANPARAQQQA